MTTLPQILEFIRSVSFGALFVNAILILAYIYFPHLFPDNFTYKEVLYVGTLAGTVLHRLIHAIIFNPLTKSISKSLAFYAKLLESSLLFRNNVLSKEEYSMIAKQLKSEYFSISLDLPKNNQATSVEVKNTVKPSDIVVGKIESKRDLQLSDSSEVIKTDIDSTAPNP